MQDDLEKKKVELNNLSDVLTADMQTYFNGASQAFTRLTNEMAEHRPALLQQPRSMASLDARL